MSEWLTKHHFGPGIYAKEQHLPKGWYAVTHTHEYDHLSILASGRASVTCAGETKEYAAPAVVIIKKGVPHTITAGEDSVWFCIHATDETDSSKIDEVLIRSH